MSQISVNGRDVSLESDGDTTLLTALRDELGLVGTRFGCGQGLCGACFVDVDGTVMPSCQTPVWQVSGQSVTTVEGLSRDSLQGDVAFVACLEQMGAHATHAGDSITVEGRPLAGIDVDMNAISDTVPTLAVVALFADGPTRIRNVAHIRHKETDRIAAVACELRKLGAEVEEFDDGLCITPRALRPAAIDTYNDHRMAMSFAVAGLKAPGVIINDPGCTAKTYPGFFADLDWLVRPRSQ